MTLRLRLCVAAGLLLVVLGVAGYVLIGTVEASQLEQIDQELQTALPAAAVLRGPSTSLAPRPPLATHSTLSDVYVAIISNGHRNVSLEIGRAHV